jgi:hypothetical protein
MVDISKKRGGIERGWQLTICFSFDSLLHGSNRFCEQCRLRRHYGDTMRRLSVPVPNVQLRVVVLPNFAPECDFPVEGFEVLYTLKRVGILEMLQNPESEDGMTKILSLG